MDKKNADKIVMVALAVLIIAIGVFLFWRNKNQTQVTQLPNVEVREYNGEKLSSISDIKDEGIKGTQYIDVKNYTLQITGLVDNPQSLTYDQVLQRPKYSKVVDLNCVEGWSAKILWEGVQVKDLIDQAGARAGANTVIFYAQDGYTTSLPLDYIRNNNILLADKMNGVILSPAKGFPFQLVAEQKWGYKWIKWLTKIEVSNDPNYKGYWESNGYNNNGDVSGSQLQIQN